MAAENASDTMFKLSDGPTPLDSILASERLTSFVTEVTSKPSGSPWLS